MKQDNLNRVKGILSARKGALVPKFTPGGLFLYKLLKNGKFVYSNDNGVSWFKDAQFTQLYNGILNTKFWQTESLYFDLENLNNEANSSLDYVNYAQEIQNKLAKRNKVSATIPGATTVEGNPNAAVEAAAAQNAEIELTQLTEKVQRWVENQNLLELGIIKQRNSLNEQGLTANQLARVDRISINNSERAARVKERILDRNTLTLDEQIKSTETLGKVSSAAINTLGSAFGASQQATDSETTRNITAAWDGAANVASQFGPIGEAVGAVMGLAKGAGDIIQGITGGTDLITKTDQWMSSPLLSWNVGIINDVFAKKSDALGVDQSTLATVGSSYGGSTNDILELSQKADKKIGLFSGKGRRQINADIANARANQARMRGVADTSTDQRLALQSMGEQAGLAYSMMIDGGYNLKYTYAAKHGGLLEWNPVIELEWKPQVELNYELPSFKEGGNVKLVEELEWIPELKDGNKLDFDTWFNSIPKEYRAAGYDYKKAYEVFDWELLSKHAKDPKNNHLGSVSPVADENGNFPFLKLGTLAENKELLGEFDWYNSEEGEDHRNTFDIKFMDGRYYYVPKQLKQGGSVGNSDIPETEETTQKNVIPEGALHKNKHHMEHSEGLTKKGIPVIDEDGEQQAEIEHSEIIFTLEVTKKLEEYYEIFYSEESTNKEKEQAAFDAGKLLVYQILENTEDRTGLIESCKKGGTLTFKKDTEELIEEVLEWMPTVVIIEESKEEKPNKKEDKLKANKELSEKDKMKEAIKEVLIELLIK